MIVQSPERRVLKHPLVTRVRPEQRKELGAAIPMDGRPLYVEDGLSLEIDEPSAALTPLSCGLIPYSDEEIAPNIRHLVVNERPSSVVIVSGLGPDNSASSRSRHVATSLDNLSNALLVEDTALPELFTVVSPYFLTAIEISLSDALRNKPLPSGNNSLLPPLVP